MKLKFAMIAALALNVLIVAPVSAQITGELQTDVFAPIPIPEVISKDINGINGAQETTLVLPDFIRLQIGNYPKNQVQIFWQLDPGVELKSWKFDNFELVKMPQLGFPNVYKHYKADVYLLFKDGIAHKAYVIYYHDGRSFIARNSILTFEAPDARGVQLISGNFNKFRRLGLREVPSGTSEATGQFNRWN